MPEIKVDVSKIPSRSVIGETPRCKKHGLYMLVKTTDRDISPDGTTLTVTRRYFCPMCHAAGGKDFVKVPTSIHVSE